MSTFHVETKVASDPPMLSVVRIVSRLNFQTLSQKPRRGEGGQGKETSLPTARFAAMPPPGSGTGRGLGKDAIPQSCSVLLSTLPSRTAPETPSGALSRGNREEGAEGMRFPLSGHSEHFHPPLVPV